MLQQVLFLRSIRERGGGIESAAASVSPFLGSGVHSNDLARILETEVSRQPQRLEQTDKYR